MQTETVVTRSNGRRSVMQDAVLYGALFVIAIIAYQALKDANYQVENFGVSDDEEESNDTSDEQDYEIVETAITNSGAEEQYGNDEPFFLARTS